MKTKLLTLGLIILSLSLQAQENVIKINPTSLFLLTGNIQYERAFNENVSGQLGLFFTSVSFGQGGERVGYSGLGITPEVRFYLLPDQVAPHGFYIGPFFRYTRFNLGVNTVDPNTGEFQSGQININSVGGGAIIGFQWVFDSNFVLDLYFGPSFRNRTLTGDTSEQDDVVSFLTTNGVGIRAGMSLGFAF